MSSNLLQEFKEDFSLLIEAGFVAVKQLDETSAIRIFNAAQAISPNSTAPQIGMGYIALNKLDVKEAAKIFEGVVKKEPENCLAQTFLGICCLLNKPKRKRGEKLIREAMEKTSDPTVRNLGEVSLEWAEKDLKKEVAPFFANKPSGEGEELSDSEKDG
ncbi:MAG: SctF chaperone SctG [Parachlamydiaceae bacterium]|nr:SctF chaperone SctG [Parachlamydiaceae bacterium]